MEMMFCRLSPIQHLAMLGFFMCAIIFSSFKKLYGIKDKKLLEAAIMRPQAGYYETLLEQAAALMESLANNHAFIDGNKRIAFFATQLFLTINGYQIHCDNEETYTHFMKLFETHTFRFPELLEWLNSNVQPIETDNLIS